MEADGASDYEDSSAEVVDLIAQPRIGSAPTANFRL